MYYHIGRCLGPCINDLNLKEYREMINQVVLFLEGKNNKIKEIITEDIEKCIENLEFERAAILKKRLEEIEKISAKQTVANLNENSSDIWGYVYLSGTLYIQVFKIRNYKVVLHDNVKIDEVDKDEKDEAFIQIISNYYINEKDVPKKMYAKLEEKDVELLNEFFKEKDIVLKVFSPKRGEKSNLVKMVENNININIEDKKNNVVEELSEMLGFKEPIDSIECYDISNLRNDYIVGCMIRFEEGKLNKKMYRKFRIKSTLTQDDPKCMYEVITRRLKHSEEWPLPDVVLIDGGKNQLKMVKKAFEDSNETANIYGMVKNDKHRTRGLIDLNGTEFDLSKEKKILNFLTFLQDEVHRFAITYHRSLRDKISKK